MSRRRTFFRPNPGRRSLLETLETRCLLASVAGAVFHDLNANGVQDPGEPGAAGRQVYIDTDGSGGYTRGDKADITSRDGSFVIRNPPIGTFTLQQTVAADWVQTYPATDGQEIVIASKKTKLTGLVFGAARTASIAGAVFDDADGNAAQGPGEAGLPGWTAYLDRDNSGGLSAGDTQAITDSAGLYSFAGLRPGTYAVRYVLDSAYTATSAQLLTVGLVSGQAATGVNFGARLPLPTGNIIRGTAFQDNDGDYRFDAGDIALAGRTVYIDADQSGDLSAGDDTAVSGLDGSYQFTGLDTAAYVVRQVVSGGVETAPLAGAWQVEFDATGKTATRNFGIDPRAGAAGTISGAVFSDTNGDGDRDAGEPALAGWTVSLDLLDIALGLPIDHQEAVTDASGNYSFTGLAANTPDAPVYYISQAVQNGYARSHPAAGSYIVSFDSATQAGVTARDFANRPLAGSFLDFGAADSLAIDQPRVTFGVFPLGATDPLQMLGPWNPSPALLDTGANGILLYQTAYTDATFNIDPDLYTAATRADGSVIQFAEIGVAGPQYLDVLVPYDLYYNGYGETGAAHGLAGVTMLGDPTTDIGVSAVIGMPAMAGRVVSIDPTPLASLSGFDFSHASIGSTFPAATAHSYDVPLSYLPIPSPLPGKVQPADPDPAYAPIPQIPNVTLSRGASQATQTLILDTGAQLSIISRDLAAQLGINTDFDDPSNPDVAGFLPVGGVGGTQDMPIVDISTLVLPTTGGKSLVFKDVQVGVLDIDPTIGGVLGSNILYDGYLDVLMSGAGAGDFTQIIMDFRSAAAGTLRFEVNPDLDAAPPAPASAPQWIFAPSLANSAQPTRAALDLLQADGSVLV